MIDLVYQEEHFKNHVAKFTDYGNIKILDFKEPGRIDYRIRFLFEEDFYRLHISGDLGVFTRVGSEKHVKAHAEKVGYPCQLVRLRAGTSLFPVGEGRAGDARSLRHLICGGFVYF